MSNVQTYHDLNVTLRKLNDAIQHARYMDGRAGMIPPEAILETVAKVGDAYATMRALLQASAAPVQVDRVLALKRGA